MTGTAVILSYCWSSLTDVTLPVIIMLFMILKIKQYSGLQLFCEDEKIFVKEGRSFKLNPMMCSGIELSVGETFTSAKMNDKFWEELMEKYLAEYLRRKFKYQSLSEELALEEDFEGEEDN